jgi:hypothetical protein
MTIFCIHCSQPLPGPITDLSRGARRCAACRRAEEATMLQGDTTPPAGLCYEERAGGSARIVRISVRWSPAELRSLLGDLRRGAMWAVKPSPTGRTGHPVLGLLGSVLLLGIAWPPARVWVAAALGLVFGILLAVDLVMSHLGRHVSLEIGLDGLLLPKGAPQRLVPMTELGGFAARQVRPTGEHGARETAWQLVVLCPEGSPHVVPLRLGDREQAIYLARRLNESAALTRELAGHLSVRLR